MLIAEQATRPKMDPDVDEFVCSAGLDTTKSGHDAYAPATRFSHAENTHYDSMARENDSHKHLHMARIPRANARVELTQTPPIPKG